MTLEQRHTRLYEAARLVRACQIAYYAYRPKNEFDYQVKAALLKKAKHAERALDIIILEEANGIQSLF